MLCVKSGFFVLKKGWCNLNPHLSHQDTRALDGDCFFPNNTEWRHITHFLLSGAVIVCFTESHLSPPYALPRNKNSNSNPLLTQKPTAFAKHVMLDAINTVKRERFFFILLSQSVEEV